MASDQTRRKRSLAFRAVLLTLLLSGCGDDTGASSRDAGADDRVPTTARALAFVAAEHTGTPGSAVSERDGAEEFASDGIGAELRYGSNGEYDGDQLVVATGKGLEQALVDCATEQSQYIAGCVNTDQGVLMWEAQTPEEDPGVVYVFVDKGETGALLFYSGPPITGDPRELNMPISTEVLFAIANDPRVDVTTTAAAVEAGADLSYWESD